MGIIRFLLAIAVVVYHSYTIFGEKMTGGIVAVQAFYIISGFYMALILNEKYTNKKGSWKLFITNRFLRLYPVYWVVLLLAIATSVVGYLVWDQPFYLYGWMAQPENTPWTFFALAIIANLFIFGSDLLFFTGVDRATGHFHLAKNGLDYKPMSSSTLFVPQIWTLGLELCFYLIAPFLVRRGWWLQLLIVVASLWYRYHVYTEHFWSWDPWNYRFFPFEIALFMAGSLAYQIYARIKERNFPRGMMYAIWIIVPVLIFYYPHMKFMEETSFRWIFYAIVFACIPFVFIHTKNMKWDRWIGELSFPVYIGHHLIMMIAKRYFWTHTDDMKWFGICTVAGSVIFAVFLWKFVVDPIERIRQRRVLQTLSK